MPQIYQYGADAMNARREGVDEGERAVMKIGNMATYMEQALASGNDRAVQGAWNAVRPELEKLSGQQMSPTWLPEYEPKMQEAKARAAALRGMGQGQGVQSTYIDDQGQRVAILRDGSTKVLGGADLGAQYSSKTVNIGGRDYEVSFDNRTGQPTLQAVDLSAAGAPGGMPPATAPNVVPNQAGAEAPLPPGVPPEETAAYRTAVQADQAGQDVNVVAVGPGGVPIAAPMNAPTPIAGRMKEDEARALANVKLATDPSIAAATKQAEYNVDMVNKPALGAAVATAEKTATADVERASEAQKKVKSARTVVSLLEDAEKILSGPTSPTQSGLGTLADKGAAFFGQTLPGGPEAKQLETIASNLTLQVPRMEGPQSNFDQQLYRDNVANIGDSTQPVASRLAALKIVRALQEKYEALNSAATQQAPQQPAKPSLDDLLKKYGG